jgi:hypothetical protein
MNNKVILPVGMFFQFIFTVCGGGLLVAGIIVGFSVGWDMTLPDNKGRISLLLTLVGGALFLVGIFIMVILYKLVTSKDTGKPDEGADNCTDISEQ